MTVLVTKRIAKMKEGDLTVKKEKKTGWWIEFDASVIFYLNSDQRDRVNDKHGGNKYALTHTRKVVGRVCYPLSMTWRGYTVRLSEYYSVYPKFDKLSEEFKTAFNNDEQEYENRFHISDPVSVTPFGYVYYENMRMSSRKFKLEGEKYVRTAAIPAWLSFIAVDNLPLESVI